VTLTPELVNTLANLKASLKIKKIFSIQTKKIKSKKQFSLFFYPGSNNSASQ